ncbi:hypothetical protein COT78_01565 [Candidatus Berkelbacteria bacterium CG10_big_fil_rev_8_21_14_0_10_43_13]|uniref:Uncharacterized protein n=1 Tax=Candidatus Berkelbacteria bacterium CG10_big_fil_rev_8_21_14_0_10_43_13 TaxID=1974514 RepID=A0A2H0W6W4_9BACT|nr:MAG: hypothetical protein COT78_01565 [Candidatus Berkelbacteria bacterium CG10_big_fil_rev_8_21_14_0_10_43_13]
MEETESNKIASNTLVQMIGRIIILALSLVSIKLVTNYLGTAGTGYYNTVITYLSFVIVIADLGLFSVTVREVSKNPHKLKQLFSNIFTIRFVTALIATFLAILVANKTSYPAEIKNGLVVAALFPIFNLAGSVYDMFFQYKLEMQKVVLAESISKIITVLSILLVVYLHLGYYAIIFTVSLAAILSFLIKAIISRHELPFVFSFEKKIVAQILKMSVPLGLVFIVNNIYFKVDTLILFYFKGAVDVGIYAVAYRVLETTLFAGAYLVSSLKPLLSTSIDQDREKAKGAITQASTFLLAIALALTIISSVFSHDIVLFLSNSSFLPGAGAMAILGLTPIFLFLSGLFGEILIAKDKKKLLTILSIFILCFNVGLNIYFIPRYSYIGAAATTVISEVVLVCTSFLAARRVIEIKLDFARGAKLIFSAAMASAFAIISRSFGAYFLLNLAITMVIYGSMIYYLNAIPRYTIDRYLGSLKARRRS